VIIFCAALGKHDYRNQRERKKCRINFGRNKHPARQYSGDRTWFVDDVFTISHRWLRGFCEEVKKQGLHLPYEIITRADRRNGEVIQLLKESAFFLRGLELRVTHKKSLMGWAGV
jgi:hypothetical protein